MKLRRRGACAALLTAIMLAGCTTPGDSAERDTARHFPIDPENALYSDAFQNIEEYYLEPVRPETVALAGLQALQPKDGSFTVKETGNTVDFLDRGTLITQMAAPAPDDVQGWAAVVSAGITAARAHVPSLAKVGSDQIDQTVFKGIITKLDRFTRYAPPRKADEQRDDRDGFGGIGIMIDEAAKGVRVSSVLPDTPAAKAGMLAGDQIIAVDGQNIGALKRDSVVKLLRGPAGSAVAIQVLRGTTALILHMKRALIVPETVLAEGTKNGIPVFRVTEFNHDTGASLKAMIAKALKTTPGGVKGIVLDLRGDPGGLLDQAVDVASIFIKHGQIVDTRGRNDASDQDLDADGDDYLTNLPLVVLVNGGSASASEVVSSTLQDNDRAVIVGSSSYGKGTVQIVLALENNAEFTLTWARLFPPGGYVLHQHGVVPLFCTADAKAGDAPDSVIQAGFAHTGLWTTPRIRLDEAEWKSLRQDCPPATEDNALDLPVARHLIEEAGIYDRALAAIKPLGTPAEIKNLANLPPP